MKTAPHRSPSHSGAANDFIQVAGQVFVDRTFPPEARARGQAFFTTMLMGVGAVIGSLCANALYVAATVGPSRHDWRLIWLVPAIVALLTFLWFGLSFGAEDRGDHGDGRRPAGRDDPPRHGKDLFSANIGEGQEEVQLRRP